MLKRVWECLHPYPEVVEGKVTEDSFVVTLGGIWEKLELEQDVQIDPRYLDPVDFYRRTHFTDAMRTILRQIIQRLRGEDAQSVYHLRVGMGGGKSHTLLLLYYLARNGDKVVPILRSEGIAKTAPKARAVVLDGMRIQALFGFPYPDGTRVQTIWGLLFKELGMYEKYKDLDSWQEVPTVPLLRDVLSKGPTIILIDELTFYTENVRASTAWSNKVQLFLQAMTAAVKETKNSVLVVTTPMRVYEEAYKIIAPILDRYSKPFLVASGTEYKQIRRRALFQDDFTPLQPEITSLANEYSRSLAIYLPSRTGLSEDAILDNYPFHPFVDTTLLKLKNHQAFQEIRDELRFLAGLTYSVYKSTPNDAYMITIGHAELRDQYVKAGTIAKLQDPILVARLDDDLTRMNEISDAELRLLASRVLTTIVLNSLASSSPLEQGVTEEDVFYALLIPDTRPEMLKKAVTECRRVLRFINLVGDRLVFGSPNINKLMDGYIKKVEQDRSLRGRWWDMIRSELDSWKESAYKSYLRGCRERGAPILFSEPNLILWPTRSELIPDDRSVKLIFLDYQLPTSSILPPEAITTEEEETEMTTRVASDLQEAIQVGREFYENYGKDSRNFKNTVFFLVADRVLIEKGGPIDHAKRLLALDEMLKDREKLETLIGDTGIKNIEQMRTDTVKDLYPSCVTVYRYLLYPSREGLEVIELGEERRLPSDLIQMVETKLRTQARKILDNVDADDLLTRYWPRGENRPEVQAVLDGFYRRPEIELISDSEVAERAIRTALKEGKLVYEEGPNIFYKREPLRLEPTAILLRDAEIITLTFEAADERNIPQDVRITIDDRDTHSTPYALSDLKDAAHKIQPEIFGDFEFLDWEDGSKDTVRTISWDYNHTLRILIRQKKAPPPQEVTLAINAINVASNETIRVSVWVDGLEYATLHRGRIAKNSVHEIRVEAPDGFLFEGWSDNLESPERTITCDIDTMLVARFRPLNRGTELWEGSVELANAYEIFRKRQQEQTNNVRLEVDFDYSSYLKNSGALAMLIKPLHQANISASGGSKLGLSQFRVQMEGTSDRSSVMKSSITQLRDYLENVTISLVIRPKDYQRLDEVVSLDALRALKQAQGVLKYQIQLRGTGPKEEKTKRTMDNLIEKFVKES
jgi:hypothetical protein